MSEPAGWYGNPDGTPTQRFWDGAQWTHNVRPVPGAPPAPTPAPALGVDPTTQLDPNQIDRNRLDPILIDPNFVETGPTPSHPEHDPTDSPESAEKPASASISDLFGVLFDFGLTRSISPALIRTIYRIGAVAVLVISAVLLVSGLRGGGLGAVVAVIVYPLEALVWLILLRVISQTLLDRSTAQEATESD